MTDLKTGYWLGSTPAAQEKVKFLGIVAAAIAAGLTIVMLARAFQFGEAAPGDLRVVLPAPQASIMKSLVEGFMSQQPVAYILFGAGAVIAVMMEMLGVPALIFALGMYLPLELNTPALVGGFLVHFLNKKAEATGGERGASIRERGIVIASGLMAGGALGGVFGAALRLVPGYTEDWLKSPFYDNVGVSQTRVGGAVRRPVPLRLVRVRPQDPEADARPARSAGRPGPRTAVAVKALWGGRGDLTVPVARVKLNEDSFSPSEAPHGATPDGGQEAAHPRRGGPRLRPQGLLRRARLGHREEGGSGGRHHLPLLPEQGGHPGPPVRRGDVRARGAGARGGARASLGPGAPAGRGRAPPRASWARTATWPRSSRWSCASRPASWSASPPPGSATTSRCWTR